MNADITYCVGVGKFLCKTCKRLREKNDATTRWYEKFMPFAYARRKNKANMQLATDVLKDKVNLFDFV